MLKRSVVYDTTIIILHFIIILKRKRPTINQT